MPELASLIASPLSGQIVYALFLAASLRLTHASYLAFRRRRSGHGIVFNSHTGKPEALVTVSLLNLHKTVVRSAVTDRQGRYRLVAPRGEYIVAASKSGFKFPSVYLSKTATTPLYDKLLPAAHIIIQDHGVITKNIPLDPEQASGRSKVYKSHVIIGKHVSSVISAVTPLIALAVAYALRSQPVYWIVFAAYLLFIVNRLAALKPAQPPYGTIMDSETKRPLSQAHVRVFESKFNKLLETQTTSPKGRYAFIVHPGAYRILISKKGYKTVMLNFPKIAQEGFLLARDVQMKRTQD